MPEPGALAGQIREQVRNYIEELSRLTCIEKTRQTIAIPGVSSSETREDSCDTTNYKLYAVQSLALSGGAAYDPSRKRGGATSDWPDRLRNASLEASSGFLRAIVNPEIQLEFRGMRTDKKKGQLLWVFTWSVPAGQGYVLEDPRGTIRVPYKGEIHVDADNGALVRARLTCPNIPHDSEFTDANVELEFGMFRIADRNVTLPSHSLVRFRMVRGAATNEADYSSYRFAAFGANSEIRFGNEVVEEK